MFLDDYEIGGSGSGTEGLTDSTGSGDTSGASGAKETTGGGNRVDSSPIERTELPTGIVTFLTKCYSPLCDGTWGCYAYDCPRRVGSKFVLSPYDTDTLSGLTGVNTASDCT